MVPLCRQMNHHCVGGVEFFEVKHIRGQLISPPHLGVSSRTHALQFGSARKVPGGKVQIVGNPDRDPFYGVMRNTFDCGANGSCLPARVADADLAFRNSSRLHSSVSAMTLANVGAPFFFPSLPHCVPATRCSNTHRLRSCAATFSRHTRLRSDNLIVSPKSTDRKCK